MWFWPIQSSKMERMSSQNLFWPEWPCPWIRAAQFSRSGRPKRGNLETCGGSNCVRVSLGYFRLNWPEPVLFGQPERKATLDAFKYHLWPCADLFSAHPIISYIESLEQQYILILLQRLQLYCTPLTSIPVG